MCIENVKMLESFQTQAPNLSLAFQIQISKNNSSHSLGQ
jgi:hypothetical protein